MGIGIETIVLGNMGADSISTLILGIINYSSLPFNVWSQLLSFIFLAITFLYDRRLLGIGSILNAFFIGETIRLVSPFMEELNIVRDNLFASLAGFILMAFGTTVYLRQNLGSGPIEGMMLCVCQLLKLPIRYGRTLLDFLLVLLGFLLGGRIGVGTIFAIFLLGPMIDLFLHLFGVLEAKKANKEKMSFKR